MEQLEAVSADGERIPYFLVAPKNLSYTRSAPLLLYGYGGFQASLTPWYSATYGKLLMERGGCLVVANIRGGGEFGPEWHQVFPGGRRLWHEAWRGMRGMVQDTL